MGKFVIRNTATGIKFDLKAGNGEEYMRLMNASGRSSEELLNNIITSATGDTKLEEGLELSCNCLGSLHEITNYPFDTGMRLLLLGAMLLLFWDSRRPAPTFMKLRKYEFEDF